MARLAHKIGSNRITGSKFSTNQAFQKSFFSSAANSLSEFNLSRAVCGITLACIFPFISACATIDTLSTGPAVQISNPVAPAPGAPLTVAASTSSSQLKKFVDLVKDANANTGFFPIYEKDDKYFLEIKPEQLDKPFFFAANLTRGIGEQFIYGGMMGSKGIIGGSYVAYFHKMGNQIQLIAKNTDYMAKEGSREAVAVQEGFSDSLLASVPIISQPHPDRKSILIEANMLLLADIPGAASALERGLRQSYGFDSRNSSITMAKAEGDQTTVTVSAHYGLSKVNYSNYTPSTLQDARSLFLGFTYNFSKLPEQPMRARAADPRIGHFTATRWDFSSESNFSPRVSYVRRWRLEKQSPEAVMSEPKQPIVYWLDKNIPERYRSAITDGILEWNKAFERIGFKNAIQVKVQPDNADWSTMDTRHASIRWLTTAKASFGAIGPSQVDPRTGEILDADIAIDAVRLRNARNRRVETITTSQNAWWAHSDSQHTLCMYSEFAANESNFALDILQLRGDILPDSPESETFVLNDLRDVVMHEVGHTLGLRHNFRASTVFTTEQLSDPKFTKANGISGSVMEYNAYNIAQNGHQQGSFSMTTLGPYDYWAIEYAYKEISADKETAELKKIAGRSGEPLLAYSTDIDASEGIDPEANTSDLGKDPLVFADRRLGLAHELWARWQEKSLNSGESYSILRRNMIRGLQQVGQVTSMAAKYVGGVTVLRDFAGSSRAPLVPISADKQRAALKLVEQGLFAADSFKFKPEFMRRLVVDEFDRDDVVGVGLSYGVSDYSLSTQVLRMQTSVLDQLMSGKIASRILDSDLKLDDPKKGFKLSELYESLTSSIWSELNTKKDINSMRRNLQREYLARLAGTLIKPVQGMPADARALQRVYAKDLLVKLKVASKQNGLSKESKAHLLESANTLDDAIKAPLFREDV